MIYVECFPQVGLGTAINVMSLLSDLKDDVTIVTSSEISLYHQLNDVFSIPNIKIEYSREISDNIIGESDYTKVVSRYFSTNIPEFEDRKVIVMTQFNGAAEFDPKSDSVTFPYNRYYPTQLYKHIFEIATLAGYEVMTLNNTYMQLGELTAFLSRNCACVIGYDGGISHLAHVLHIPTITFPWKCQTNGIEFKNPDGEPNTVHLLHLDKKTYIPDNVNEIYSWEPNFLQSLICQLNNDKGNNKFIGNYCARSLGNQLCLYPTDRQKSIVYVNCSKSELAIINANLNHPMSVGGF